MEEEINLIEIFETIRKNIKIILLFTILSAIFYTFFSLAFKSPYYQAVTLLTITEAVSVSEEGTVQKIGLPISFYESLLGDPNFIKSVLKEAKASGEINQKVKSGGILKITVKAKTKEKAREISERIIERISKSVEELRKAQESTMHGLIVSRKKIL